MGIGQLVMLTHKRGDGIEGEQVEVVDGGITAHGMVEPIEQLVETVAGPVFGLLEIGGNGLPAAAHIGLEKLWGDQRMVEHLAQEGEKLLGILAEEIERDIALTHVGHALDDDAAEVEELGNGGGFV